MATLKTIKRELLGEEVSFTLKVSSAGRFTTSWPAAMLARCERFEHEFKTLEDLLTAIDAKIDELNDQATVVEYLLAYTFAGHISPERWTTPTAELELVFTLYKKTTIGHSVEFNYMTYDTFGSQKKDHEGPIPNYFALGNAWRGDHYKDMNGRVAPPVEPSQHNPHKQAWGVMPLTQENFEFFESIRIRMGMLRDRLKDFLEPETIQQRIEGFASKQLTSGVLEINIGDE